MTIHAPERNPLADLPPMPDTSPPVLTPGLLRALGITPQPKTDYQQSIDSKLTESFEDYCERISTKEGSDA
jgi:hypothetical protein